jgi:Na+-transporting NADH:ubiquinone oxidoreductase subunit C
VSYTAVALKPRQEANLRLDKRKNVLLAAGLLDESGKNDVQKIFNEKIKPVMIETATGEKLAEDKMTGILDPENYNLQKIARDPATSQAVPADKILAGIKRVPTHSLVYYVMEDNKVNAVILPVYGVGLWSTMYGFLALDRDLKVVKGFTFYEHGETPGLGGEVDNPRWKALWPGKIVFDDAWNYKLKVLKGKAGPNSISEIDGLSGATITTRGIDNLVRFWLGEAGFGPFLEKLKKEGV